jgi:YesN/AraC family two-component response regulator
VTAPAALGVRLVIADNDPDALDLLDLDLGLEGHLVVGRARNGQDAIELCRELSPDVLVVDLRMPPGPDGLAVVQALADQPDLKMIIYTNYRDPVLAARAAKVGAGYLLKGDLRTLRAAIGDLVRRDRVR